MKNLLIIILTLFLLVPASVAKAQSMSTEINLREIIDSKLIKESRKEESGEIQTYVAGTTEKIVNKNKTFYAIIFVLLEIALLTKLYMKWKERKRKTIRIPATDLKENIEKLRLEKIIRKNNEKVEALRRNLGQGKITFDVKKNNLTKLAKELSISKGELYLAAKLKLMTGK